MNMDESLKTVDLFAGGGGFSEGFRQAGFKITHAIDIDEGACETYELNHPETEVINEDLIKFEPSELPDDVEVVIGSPPCGEFSTSKRGGAGDAEEGMKLVDRFLYFVHELDPEYWIMENVPRLENHLTKYRGGEAGGIPELDDEQVCIERSDRFMCSDYGTPQRRRRLFSGQFPDPVEPDDDETPVFLDQIRDDYPPPTERAGSRTYVEDSVYNGLKIHVSDFSDHFYDTYLTPREAKEIEVLKKDHSFYGPMSFPDDKEDTARTVIAMNRRIARETLVLEEESPPSHDPSMTKYRKPTIRELATIQGFPITYQFTGTTIAQKRRRVGDAVPPTMAYRLALAILRKEGENIGGYIPDVSEEVPELDHDFSDEGTTPRSRRKLPLTRSFRHHVPYDNMREYRIDLETTDGPAVHPGMKAMGGAQEHPVRFQAVFYEGYAKSVQKEAVDIDQALSFLEDYTEDHPEEEQQVLDFLGALGEELDPMVPDATTLQGIRTRRASHSDPIEYDILEAIAAKEEEKPKVVDRFFPREDYPLSRTHPVDVLGGTEMPVRTLVKLVGANYVAHKLNHCGRWMTRHLEFSEEDEEYGVYIPEDWKVSKNELPSEIPCVSRSPANGCIEDLFKSISNRGWEQIELQSRSGRAD